MSVFVIAECGSCHEGTIENAVRLIDAAKTAGADAAKFQYWSSSARLAARRNDRALAAKYEAVRIPAAWLDTLATYCGQLGIDFMCTTYLPEDVPVVAPLVRRLKIASFEATDAVHLVAHVAPLDAGKDVLVSLGMGASLGDRLSPTHEGGGRVYRLYCVSAYPTPAASLQLSRMWTNHWRQYHGFSDHSEPTNDLTGALAVALGARFIERHLRLEWTDPACPDYPVAMPPLGLLRYVEQIRAAEILIGNATPDQANPIEDAMLPYRVTQDRV